jgi:hypothetical protein
MKASRARIVVILDRSGSMEPLREATVESFNQFVKAQREIWQDCSVKLVQFDTEYEVVFDKPLNEAPLLTQATFVPRGATALLDAQGRTIVEVGRELAALEESERPAKVIVVTLTDGLENSSKEYSRTRVAELVQQQRDIYKWEFVYLGANQDAVRVAATMNIPAASSMTYGYNSGGARAAMWSVTALLRRARQGKEMSFTDEERAAAVANE